MRYSYAVQRVQLWRYSYRGVRVAVPARSLYTVGTASILPMGFFHRERLERHFSQGMKFAVVGGSAAILELVTVTILV